jgi:membrane protease subunit HflC
MNRFVVSLAVILVGAAILLGASLFTVDQTEQALVTQFGDPVKIVRDPGLHIKLPFVQTVVGFDNRRLAFDMPGEEVLLGDQRRLVVDSFAILRIADPLKYYQAVGIGEEGIRGRLTAIVQSSLRRVLGSSDLLSVLSADRAHIMTLIRDQVNAEMQGFGVTIEDVRIRRADLPEENTQAVLGRMKAERERINNQIRAEGAEAAARITANANRERTVILAEAKSTSDQLRGQGEEQASRTYAAAYGQDPAFFAVWRTMQAYLAVFASGSNRLVLTPDSDFLRLMQSVPKPGGQ